MCQDKLKKAYRSVKFEVKYFFKNFPLKKKITAYFQRKKLQSYKKKYNFIPVKDFMSKFENHGITIDENVFDYKTNLFTVENGFVSCYHEIAYVHQFGGDKAYTFKESCGINKRIDADEIFYEKPLDLRTNVVEEDEVCMLCFYNAGNYWHFTFDVLPKMMIMEKRGYTGKYVVNINGCVKEFLQMLDIPEDRIIYCPPGMAIKAKKVYMFDEYYGIGLGGKWLDDTREFIVERIEKKHGSLIDDSYPKKIYVSRIGTRRIINENQVIDYLAPQGYAVIVPENFSIYEQIKFFANVDIVVAPHGANVTNVLYSKKGTTLVECFGHYWVNPCMVTTVELLNLDYHMICERFMHNIPNTGRFSHYIIDMTILKCIIHKITEYRKLKELIKK